MIHYVMLPWNLARTTVYTVSQSQNNGAAYFVGH